MNTLADLHRRTVALALALVVAGVVALTIGWVGVSATLVIPTQVSFAVSGGIGGFALVGAGLAVLAIQQRRRSAAEDRRAFARFASELEDLADVLARRRVESPARPGGRRRRVLKAR